MTYFLDTNMCIYYLKGSYEQVRTHLLERRPEEIKIPSIVKAELLYGAEKSRRKGENRKAIGAFLFPFEIIPFGDEEAVHYSVLRSAQETKGELLGPNDLIIASTIMAREGILVTHNEREFGRIEGLEMEDWTR